jgi:hypothetical protein
MKTLIRLTLACVVTTLSGCNSPTSYQSARRGPVWVVPVTGSVSAAPALALATNAADVSVNETNQVFASARTNARPPVANVLSPADIKEMSGKGVSEQTILNVLRSSRAIYTLTSKDVTDLQEAKVSRTVIDYLLSTPLLYKDDLLRSRAYYYYTPLYPGYWHWSFHDYHHGFYRYDSHHSYGHDSHHGGLHH